MAEGDALSPSSDGARAHANGDVGAVNDASPAPRGPTSNSELNALLNRSWLLSGKGASSLSCNGGRQCISRQHASTPSSIQEGVAAYLFPFPEAKYAFQ